SSPLVDAVIVAQESNEMFQVSRKNDWNARMTSPDHRSGTERVHEISNSVHAEVYINVQGDEPMTRPEHIASLLGLMENPAVQVGTLAKPSAAEDVINVHANKVVMDLAGRALYFSHATIPFDRDGANPRYLKHLGIYGYRKSALDRFVALPESSLERIERLEQLRFLENGVDIHVAVTPYDSIGIDTEDDLRQFEQSQRGQRTCAAMLVHSRSDAPPRSL